MKDINRVVDFAKDEFAKYAELTFIDFDEVKDQIDIYIGLNENGEIPLGKKDEIFIDVKGSKGVITGSNAGSVLIAVYRFFIECGCRFLRPGKDGEYINKCNMKDVSVYVKEKATSDKRGMIIEGSCSFENVYDIIDFCPKIALNNYEFQFMFSETFFKRWYEHIKNPFKESENVSPEEIRKHVICLKDEVKKRGMSLETMGHGFTKNPEVDVVKFALADNINVACECENCSKLRLSDHYVSILNLMDEKMTEAGLEQKIGLCVYIDLLWAPLQERIKNKDRFLCALFPISHTCHEPIDIDKIPNDYPYPYVLNKLSFTENPTKDMAFLKKWQEVCPYDWYLGEYYYMWDHYLDIGYQQIARVLHTDICNQKKIGLNGMAMYQPQRCAFPTAMGFYTYGKALWNNQITFEEISNDYFKHAYGEGWEKVQNYLQSLSDTFDMKLKPGGRNYSYTECISAMEKCLEIVKEFKLNFKEINYKSKLEEVSWNDLKLHNDFVEKYLTALLKGFHEDKEKGAEMVEELVEWMWKIEDDVQPRWDVSIHSKFLPIWYERIFKIRDRELRGEKYSDIVMGPDDRAGSEGVQA